MAKKSGLGRGLEALIPTTTEIEVSPQAPASGVSEIPVANIHPNPHQPRKQFDADTLTELAESIREHGILSPLVVISTDKPDHFQLIAGERRLRAAKLAGLMQVPAIVRTATEQEQLEFAIIENVQREDLNAMERAQAYQSLLEGFSLTHEEISQRVGKSRAAVTNALRLLNLPAVVQQAIQDEAISEGHGRALLALPSPRAMEAALETVVKQGLNVRQTEQLISRLAGKADAKPAPKPKQPELTDLENRLREALHTKVNLQGGKRGGTITIFYYSDEELNNLTQKLGLHD